MSNSQHSNFDYLCAMLQILQKTLICAQLQELLSSSHKGNAGIGEPLTPTEKEILSEIVWGKTAKDIAQLRNVSLHTVITHRKNIYRKLDVNNSQEASRYALRAGIVDAVEYYI